MHRRHIVVSFADRAEVERERDGLARGGMMARGVSGVAAGAECELELVHPAGARLLVPAQAVWGTADGTAFAFRNVTSELRAALAAWCDSRGPDREDDGSEDDAGSSAGDAPLDLAHPGDDESDFPDIVAEEPPSGAHGAEDESEGDTDRPAAATAGHRGPRDRPPLNTHERLRGLSAVEQQRVAREGEASERIVLERLYGKAIWDALLRNPRLTIPEVTHLARMGSMPRPLLELIVGNPAWLQAGQVRRALLGNTRLSPDMVDKVLRAMPRNELRLVATQTIYAAPIRSAARRLMGL
jgi:hypothetical protein